MEILAEAGADVLACETVPAAAEAEALLVEADALGVPVWMSLTTVVDAEGVVRTRRGERAADVFAMAGVRRRGDGRRRELHAPSAVGPSVARRGGRRQAGRRLPEQRRGLGRRRPPLDRLARHRDGRRPGVGRAGARLVGGCCRVRPAHIAELAAALHCQVTFRAESPSGGRDFRRGKLPQRMGLPPVTATRAPET